MTFERKWPYDSPAGVPYTVGYRPAEKNLYFYNGDGSLYGSIAKGAPGFDAHARGVNITNSIVASDALFRRSQVVPLMDYAPRYSAAGTPADFMAPPDASNAVFGAAVLGELPK